MNRLSIIGLVIVVVFVAVALFAPWIATHDVGLTNLSLRYMAPSAGHWFGTDSTGRDIFSRVVFGRSKSCATSTRWTSTNSPRPPIRAPPIVH